jgi:hypothetical protein
MDKQIEEMAKVIAKYISSRDFEVKFITNPDSKAFPFSHTAGVAEDLYNAGYRKIPEGAVVLTGEEFEALTSDLDKTDYGDFENGYSQGYKQSSKETAEKLAKKLKAKLNEWLEDNEDLNGKIDFGIAMIELIGVKSLDGEVIAESLIDEICKRITEGKK